VKIEVVTGQLQEAAADTLIVNLFEGVTAPGGATGAVDAALDGAISELIKLGDLKGKTGECTVVYPRSNGGTVGASRVLVVGLGKRDEFDAETARRAAGVAAARARKLGAKKVATVVHGAGVGGLAAAEAAAATAEGTLLALYRYDAPKQDKSEAMELAGFSLVEHDEAKAAEMAPAVEAVQAISRGVYLARDLVNGPSNSVTPEYLGDVAVGLANEHGFGVTVGDRVWAEEHDMGAFLAVSAGTARDPAFIVLEHKPEGAEGEPVVLVGKGMTFDTGGISLNPAANMQNMISDMGGAGAVLGTMKAVGELNLNRHIVGIAVCTENMPDGAAYRPGDVLTASNGKTIEVTNTDAEGRLVLADALVYAERFKPAAVVDLATLTGACVVALGEDTCAGLFSNDDSLRDGILAAADRTFERAWQLPLYSEFSKAMESDVADLRNSSAGRAGGASTGAAFLKEFVDYPWVHLDIAGMAYSGKARDYIPKGASGYGVRLLVDWLRNS